MKMSEYNYSIEAKNLNKIYNKNQHTKIEALNNFNIKIPKGSIYGLLGPNGAGKSTFINILGSLVKKDSGTVNICGINIDENPKNNHYTNLKWGTHKENLQVKCLPEGTIREHPRYCGRAPTKYIKKNGEWVLIPSNKPPWNKGMKFGEPDGTIRKRANGYYYIKEEGKWKHIKQKDYFKYGV